MGLLRGPRGSADRVMPALAPAVPDPPRWTSGVAACRRMTDLVLVRGAAISARSVGSRSLHPRLPTAPARRARSSSADAGRRNAPVHDGPRAGPGGAVSGRLLRLRPLHP